MSSDEGYSLVCEPNETSLSQIQASVSSYQKKYELLLKEQKQLRHFTEERRHLAQQFQQRRNKLMRMIKEEEEAHQRQITDQRTQLKKSRQEEEELLEKIQQVEEALKEEEDQKQQLKQQANVFAAVPERKLVFLGKNGNDTEAFELTSHVVYPMEGGTALVTFEEEVTARNILSLKRHQVGLGGDYSILVETGPVCLMLPQLVEIDTDVCPRRVLVSNLPRMDTEYLLNKLEIHFSKSKNRGGEVEECEMLPDSGTVVLTFVQQDVARGLTQVEFHDVPLQQKQHRVRVTPFLNGTISTLKTKMVPCPRTVLLTGIPPVMEQENLQDLLEIHFQKLHNGGGEIEAFLYNPLGQNTAALFSSGGLQDE